MSRRARLGLIAAAVAVAVVAFLIARPGEDDEKTDNGDRTAQTATQPQTATDPQATTQVPPPEPPPERIRVRGGEPVGGVRELEFEKGDEVRLEVRADVTDEVHVHGYDLFEEVRPGKAARLRFDADVEGIFEVELEGSHTHIAELRVEP